MVSRQFSLFAAFPTVGKDDLVSNTLLSVRNEWRRFDPERGAADKWIAQLAASRLIDQYRSLDRRRERYKRYAELVAAPRDANNERMEPSLRHEADGDDLVDFVGNAYRAARRNFIAYRIPLRLPKQKLSTMDRAQATALLALKRRKNLSCRGVVMLLEQRPALLQAIGLAHVPHYSVFSRIESAIPAIDFRPLKVA